MSRIDYVPRLNAYYQGQGFPPYKWSVNESSPWTPFAKPLGECRVALLTSGGVSRQDQPPFDPFGVNDLSVRGIPKETAQEDLVINDGYYDHTDADKDINCIFPLERFNELEEEGYIGEFAPTAYSGFMGRIYKRTALQKEAAPEFMRTLREEKVDVLFLVPT